MTRSVVAGHFIEGARGPIFVLARKPVVAATGTVLVVPPFAEEMNKCRRMVTEVALGLAGQRLATVVPDLHGTGDSGGSFADADWATWRADLAATANWCASSGPPVSGLLAIRLGCALALDALNTGELPACARSVLWQPVFDGGRHLAQFLRLRIAASLMEDRQESLADLKAWLSQGEIVEVAGYGLPPQLAADLEQLRQPRHLPASFGEMAWFEIAREPGASLSPSSARLFEGTRLHGVPVVARSFVGEPFWSSTEIVVNADVVRATVPHLASATEGGGLERV